jgi:hypothetical protein
MRGKYKDRISVATPNNGRAGLYTCHWLYKCQLTQSDCLKQDYSLCKGCVVLCKRKHQYPFKKCDTCEQQFKCWTGTYDIIRKGRVLYTSQSPKVRRRRR